MECPMKEMIGPFNRDEIAGVRKHLCSLRGVQAVVVARLAPDMFRADVTYDPSEIARDELIDQAEIGLENA